MRGVDENYFLLTASSHSTVFPSVNIGRFDFYIAKGDDLATAEFRHIRTITEQNINNYQGTTAIALVQNNQDIDLNRVRFDMISNYTRPVGSVPNDDYCDFWAFSVTKPNQAVEEFNIAHSRSRSIAFYTTDGGSQGTGIHFAWGSFTLFKENYLSILTTNRKFNNVGKPEFTLPYNAFTNS